MLRAYARGIPVRLSMTTLWWIVVGSGLIVTAAGVVTAVLALLKLVAAAR
jgi:hypothetical protein